MSDRAAISNLRDELAGYPLSVFRAADLDPLWRLMRGDIVSDAEVAQLESRIEKSKETLATVLSLLHPIVGPQRIE